MSDRSLRFSPFATQRTVDVSGRRDATAVDGRHGARPSPVVVRRLRNWIDRHPRVDQLAPVFVGVAGVVLVVSACLLPLFVILNNGPPTSQGPLHYHRPLWGVIVLSVLGVGAVASATRMRESRRVAQIGVAIGLLSALTWVVLRAVAAFQAEGSSFNSPYPAHPLVMRGGSVVIILASVVITVGALFEASQRPPVQYGLTARETSTS